tara:strand:+ start:8952 stop:9320 length:369 start_codon:yes stop_codon:yes gene_type:complete
MQKIKSNPSKTILTISLGFLFIYFLGEYKWALFSSIFVSTAGLISDRISKVIEKIWFKLSEILGMIIPNITLTIVFYFLLFPIAVLSKIFTKNKLINLNPIKESNYLEVNKVFTKEFMKNSF